MRIVSCALGVAACLAAGRAEADVSKAMAAAKDNLPADTQLVVVIDVATIYKNPIAGKVIEALRSEGREFREVHDLVKKACGWDPLSVIDGVVIGADPKNERGIAYLQLSIDRKKASKCLEQAINALGKGKGGKLTVKQDGAYTVASKGDGKNDTAYFPWVGDNVVAIGIKPERKDAVDAWFGQKTFGKSAVSALLGKLDGKAVMAGAFASSDGSPIEPSFMPVVKAYGNLTVNAGKLTGQLVATTVDAKAASKLADEGNKELQHTLQKDRTPAAVKKIMLGVSIAAKGSDLTISGSTTDKEITAAFDEVFTKKQKQEAESKADMAETVTKFEGFSKKMCACKDKACADKVQDEMTKWATEMAKKASKASMPDEKVTKKLTESMTKYTECMTKILSKQP